MRRGVKLRHVLDTCVLLSAWLAGCQGLGRRQPPPEPVPPGAPTPDPVLAGTIGAATYLAAVEGQPVRGFGVVIGLGQNGSSDCPTFIREYVVDSMLKERETWGSLEERQRFSPSELIESPTTAVVEITGVVPAVAARGTYFDLLVQAIPGTATRSLAGGLLLPCELRLASLAGSDEQLLAASIVARAAGPIFVNPFATGTDAAEQGSPREGYVLSGGQTTQPRTLRLLLREPSYPLARRLETRINERFGQRPPVAEALSRGYLVLKTPPAYARRGDDFIRLLPHVYVEDSPAFIEMKLRELVRLVVLPDADHDRISLAWEGIGPTALSQIQPLYSHREARVRFYAARAGLRLKDATALPVLAEIATGREHALALLAVQELGYCPYPQAALELMPLLDSSDQEIRIAAYTALLNHPQPAIRTRRFPHALDPMQLNLSLDVVDSAGEPLIYVRRSQVPRMALFGGQTPVTVPLFYTAADDSVTLSAVDEASDITLLTRRYGKYQDPIMVPPRVADLIAGLADLPAEGQSGELRGLGLPYSQVVQVLSALCQEGTIAAHLEVERVSLTELLGPAPRPERPEADQPPALPSPPEQDEERGSAESAQTRPES